MVARWEAGDTSGGSLVFTSSGSAFFGQPRGQHYGGSKAAVLAMSRAIAVEFARYGVRSNAVVPGWIDTEMATGALHWDKFIERNMPRTPARRWGVGRRLRRHRRLPGQPGGELPHRRHDHDRRRLLHRLSARTDLRAAGRARPVRWTARAARCLRSRRCWFQRCRPQPASVPPPKHEQPADAVDPVVVGRDDDAEQRRQRVEEHDRPLPAPAQQRPHRHGAPRRPADVHARHRRVLVGDVLHRLGVERPRPAVLGQRVDVAERAARGRAGRSRCTRRRSRRTARRAGAAASAGTGRSRRSPGRS